ncbi:MAG: glycosyltransferase [Deltaproteobacteria bacterium]|nr:glycosyltransferase [Deltaproteobacteria bacterium]
MKILFDSNTDKTPLVSIILIDWSVRESFHILRYLGMQSALREQYEIIWIEYYKRRAPEIARIFKECEGAGAQPPVDKWIIMDMPENVCHHKHLMYNCGIIASRGDIVAICDSDAVLGPAFVESIIKSFKGNPSIVLHMDEVRNTDKRFYPFNYPSTADILGEGCINFKGGATTGLMDRDDPLHTRNYGACMCARREDIINIGGADEHIDYLGHICGPYEMTFRLVNHGRTEAWHKDEFLYHLWHPGIDGDADYMGPHDGRNISTVALKARTIGRVLPLSENPAIKALRLKQDGVVYEPFLNQAVPEEEAKNWTFERLIELKRPVWEWDFVKHPFVGISLVATFLKMLLKQFHMKVTKFSRTPMSLGDLLKKALRTYEFVKNMNLYYIHMIERSNDCLRELGISAGKEFTLFGTGDAAEVLYKMTSCAPVKVGAVYDRLGNRKFFNFDVMPVEAIRYSSGKVVVTLPAGMEDSVGVLKKMGVEEERIVVL